VEDYLLQSYLTKSPVYVKTRLFSYHDEVELLQKESVVSSVSYCRHGCWLV